VPIFAAFPVAPPRLAELGFTDTVSNQAAVALTGSSTAFYNAFAAVPSLHVGFAFVIGIAGIVVARSRWAKLLAASLGPLVTLTVVATANHYVFDALAGVAVTAAGSAVWQLNARRERLLVRRPSVPTRPPRRRPDRMNPSPTVPTLLDDPKVGRLITSGPSGSPSSTTTSRCAPV
jgi:hypothetical protein